MFSLIATIIAFSSMSLGLSRDLPTGFPKCSNNNLEFDECVLRAFNTLRPYARNGVKDIGLPSLNLLVLPKITIKQESSLANYTFNFVNYTIQGIDNYDIKEFHYDPKTMTIRIRIEFESVPINVIYEGSGHVINVSVYGKGSGRAACGPINATLKIEGEMKHKHGVDYYHPSNVKVDLIVDDGTYYLDGLFVDEELARAANNLLNANSKLTTEVATPVLETLAEMGVMRFIKTLTRSIPYDKLFPPRN